MGLSVSGLKIWGSKCSGLLGPNKTQMIKALKPSSLKYAPQLEGDVVCLKKNLITHANKKNLKINLNNIKPGEFINEGNSAQVYEVAGMPRYVIRVEKGTTFNPSELKPMKDSSGVVVASDASGSVTVLKKVKGEPLYGKNWNIFSTPSFKEYNSALTKVTECPDSTFANYIDDLAKVRKNGFEIDSVNPNNFLLDGNKINIIDLSKNEKANAILKMEDFYPFLDSYRLGRGMKKFEPEQRKIVYEKVRKFIDRMSKISKEKGTPVEIEKLDHSKLQDGIVYLYHGDEMMLGYSVK